jgi:hypothetical protein
MRLGSGRTGGPSGIRGFGFGTIESAIEPNAFTPDVAAPNSETRVTRGRDLKAEVRQRRVAALRPLLGELQVGLQERPGARKRGADLIELRRGRLKDVGHFHSGLPSSWMATSAVAAAAARRVASSSSTSFEPHWMRSGAIPRRSANSGLSAAAARLARPA